MINTTGKTFRHITTYKIRSKYEFYNNDYIHDMLGCKVDCILNSNGHKSLDHQKEFLFWAISGR